jgi:adhesin transport system outer membrane protein
MKSATTFLRWCALPLVCTTAVAQSTAPQVTQPPAAAAVAAPSPALLAAPAELRWQGLDALVRRAIARAPTVQEAQANWHAAEQDIAQARGALWPKVELSANSAAAKIESSASRGLTGRLGVTATYNLYDFGRVRSQIETREFQAASLSDQATLARETAANDTVNAYLLAIKLQRSVQVYQQHLADLRVLVDKLSEIISVFPGRRSELTQAQTRAGQAGDALVSLLARQRENHLVLMRLVGAEDADMAMQAAAQAAALPSFAVADVAQVLAQAQLTHPSLLAARNDAAAARAQLAEARAAAKPQVNAVLSKQSGHDIYGYPTPAQVYLSANWVAFDGHSTQANELALAARAEAAQARAEQAVLDLDYKIRSAGADYEAQTRRMRELAQLVVGTDQVRKDYYDQWRELGRRSLLDVLSAEGEHLSTRLNLVSSEVDRQAALARMHYEAGRLADWLLTQPAAHLEAGKP